MRATFLISLSTVLAVSMPAAGQVSSSYTSVSTAQSAVPVQIATSNQTVTNRVVEPVTQSFDSLISAPIQYDENGVAKAQYFKASDLTPEQNRAFQEEVRRVRNYQSHTGASSTPDYLYSDAAPNESLTYGSSYETQSVDQATLSAPSSTTTYSSGSYEIDLYEPQSAEVYSSQPYTSGTYTSTPIQSFATSTHTVSKGDTLYNISKRYNVSIGQIQDENGLSGTTLSLGQALRIPSSGTQASSSTLAQPIFVSAPVRDGAVTRRVVQPIASTSTPVTYAVLKKDTLYSIAKRSCVSINDLALQNGITDPSSLQLGQQLTLPLGHCLVK